MSGSANYRRVVAMGAALALAGGLALSQPTTATAAPAASRCTGASVPGDVNGDGHAEVAVTQTGRKQDAGAVHVFYGTGAGLVTKQTGRALDDQFIDQGSAGVPGSNEVGDYFGSATAWGDFDSDGCADLAVGAPGENGGTGALTVVYGSPKGLGITKATQHFTLAGLFGVPAPEAAFGGSLAVGDLDDDGTADLAIGASLSAVGTTPGAGAVAVLYGSHGGGLDTGTRAELLNRDTPGMPGSPRAREWFGEELAVGDFDGNGVTQLAIVSLGSALSGELGGIQVVERGPGGFTRPQPDPIGQQEAQSSPRSKPSDEFGSAAAAGDFNADGFTDLAVGAPGRGWRPCTDELHGRGEVSVLFGSASGLTPRGRQLWTQDDVTGPGTGSANVDFGANLVAAELNGTRGAELAISTAGIDVGTTTVLRGGRAGLTTTGGQRFTPASAGIGSGPLAAAYVQRGSYANLVIAQPTRPLKGVLAVGLVKQLASTRSGPTITGSRALHLDTAGVKGTPEREARFGSTVS